jgi:hypothetical protein
MYNPAATGAPTGLQALATSFAFDDVEPPAVVIAPPPVRDYLGFPLLEIPLHETALQGIFPCAVALWHGNVEHWPPLRLSSVHGLRHPWKSDAKTHSVVSKIKLVANAIDKAVGIPPLMVQERLTQEQVRAAYAYCNQLERSPDSDSFTTYYKTLVRLKQKRKLAAHAAASTRGTSDAAFLGDDDADSEGGDGTASGAVACLSVASSMSGSGTGSKRSLRR